MRQNLPVSFFLYDRGGEYRQSAQYPIAIPRTPVKACGHARIEFKCGPDLAPRTRNDDRHHCRPAVADPLAESAEDLFALGTRRLYRGRPRGGDAAPVPGPRQL